MANCRQNSTQTILEHGQAVQHHLSLLYDYTTGKMNELPNHILPDWLIENRSYISAKLLDKDTLMEYALYHDCGKPLCQTIGQDGKIHFPDHTQVSYNLWKDQGGDETIGQLILHDMDIHTISADAIPEFAKSPLSASLLLSGLAEIHANAEMFGGIESTSFKIKYKHIYRRGKALLAAWKALDIA